MTNWRHNLAVAIVAMTFTLAAAGQEPLRLNEVIEAGTSAAAPRAYIFQATGPGILMVAVRANQGADLTLMVTDQFGRAVVNGEADNDLGGNVGAEQVAATIPGAGSYRVEIGAFEQSATFALVAGFVAFPQVAAAEAAPLPVPAPEDAEPLALGPIHEMRPAGAQQWHRVVAPAKGHLFALTRGTEGDLVLDLFRAGQLHEPAASSDQDQGGNMAHEATALEVEADEVIFVRVRSHGEDMLPRYRIRAIFAAD